MTIQQFGDGGVVEIVKHPSINSLCVRCKSHMSYSFHWFTIYQYSILNYPTKQISLSSLLLAPGYCHVSRSQKLHYYTKTAKDTP